MYSVPTKMNAKKLPPSSRPGDVRAGERAQPEDRQRQDRLLARLSITRNATSRAAAAASTAIVRVAPQPYCGAWEIASTSSTSPPVPVIAPAASNRRRVGGEPALGHDPRRQRERGGPDRDVQVEDVLPAGVAGEKPAGDQPDGRAGGAEAAPDPERLVALGALVEHVHHDRERGGEHERRAEPLHRAAAIRNASVVASAHGQRRGGEHASPAIRTRRRPSRSAARPPNSRKPPNVSAVSGRHPLQARVGEVQVATDRRAARR